MAFGGLGFGQVGAGALAGAMAARLGRALTRGGCGARGADRRRGEGAGLPEQEDLLQAVEDAREDGGDHSVQGGGQPSPISPRGGRAGFAQAGDLSAEGGGLD